MRKFWIAMFAALVMGFGSQASASTVPTEKLTLPQAVVVTVEADSVAARRGPVRNILRGLLELERRKNAWLRRTFMRG